MTTDHNALRALAEQVQPGWTVDISGEDLVDNREGAKVTGTVPGGIVIRPRRPWSSQGRTYPCTELVWAEWEGDDYEVDGLTLRLYITATAITSRSRPGQRQLVKTYRFHSPRP